MIVHCVWEHNQNDTLLHAVDFAGAYARGECLKVAISKMRREIRAWFMWLGEDIPSEINVEIIGEKVSDLNIKDADSDIIFESEKGPLSVEEYQWLKALALKSAEDFLVLYQSVPDKKASVVSARKTFYGDVPRTADEMYEHTKNVNAYYFGEIKVDADNQGTIYECRERGFTALEAKPDFLKNQVIEGSYGEEWSLRKVFRRFIWHDRIHAKAMYRMASRVFGTEHLSNVFFFDEEGDLWQELRT